LHGYGTDMIRAAVLFGIFGMAFYACTASTEAPSPGLPEIAPDAKQDSLLRVCVQTAIDRSLDTMLCYIEDDEPPSMKKKA
jgi:hypothetical protein